MLNKLESIVLQKQQEVAVLHRQISLRENHPIISILNGESRRESTKSFKSALCADLLTVIAEIKRQSPSKGVLAAIDDPAFLAEKYVLGGASAISVLTDQKFFNGNLQDLKIVATKLEKYDQPTLRKDFIIDAIQIAEAIMAGADAVLAIVAVLGKKTKSILDAAKTMNIEVLVEVHNEFELDIALASGAEIIGVNNRNLTTLEVDTRQALHLIKYLPKHIIKVAESGISEPSLAREYYQAGFNAVLIGEALVKSASPDTFIRACRYE